MCQLRTLTSREWREICCGERKSGQKTTPSQGARHRRCPKARRVGSSSGVSSPNVKAELKMDCVLSVLRVHRLAGRAGTRGWREGHGSRRSPRAPQAGVRALEGPCGERRGGRPHRSRRGGELVRQCPRARAVAGAAGGTCRTGGSRWRRRRKRGCRVRLGRRLVAPLTPQEANGSDRVAGGLRLVGGSGEWPGVGTGGGGAAVVEVLGTQREGWERAVVRAVGGRGTREEKCCACAPHRRRRKRRAAGLEGRQRFRQPPANGGADADRRVS